MARVMALKNIAAGLAHGGGKVMVAGDPKMDFAKKEARSLGWGSQGKLHLQHPEPELTYNNTIITGPDISTS